MNKKNILFFFCAAFPFEKKEIFIEKEINILKKRFDELIIISGAKNYEYSRKIDTKVKVIKIKYDQIITTNNLLITLFSWLFFKEIFNVIFIYKKVPSYGIVKTIFKSASNSLRLKSLYEEEIKSFKNSNIFLYSFWFNDSAVALGMLKIKYPELIAVSRTHRWDLYFEENKYNYLPFRYQFANKLDKVYSASLESVNYCRYKWKINSMEKLGLSRLGVKNQKFLDANISNNLIVSCSNVISVKRIDKIIKSLALTKTKKINWIHFGDGKELEKLKKLAFALLNNKVNYQFIGHVDNKFLLNWYEKYVPSLFINLSDSEGIPVSIMEAMSFGIPCIVKKVGGCIELVTNEVGFPLDKNCLDEEVAQKIDEFFALENSVKLKLRLRSHSHIKKKFNANNNYNTFCDDLLSLSNSKI